MINKLSFNGIDVISDISKIIFHLCTISDKRNLIRTCKNNYICVQFMRIYEKQFKKIINGSIFFNINEYYHDNYCSRFIQLNNYYCSRFTQFDNILYKHTLELIYDGYEHLIPDTYICQQNRILYMYPEIYRLIAKRGNLSLIKKCCKLNMFPENI